PPISISVPQAKVLVHPGGSGSINSVNARELHGGAGISPRMQNSSTQWNASSYHSKVVRKNHSTQGDAPLPSDPHCDACRKVVAFQEKFHLFLCAKLVCAAGPRLGCSPVCHARCRNQARRLKYWTARSCFFACSSVSKVPRFFRFPVLAFFF